MAAPPDDLLDHDYDGIKEFDNPLPKWWVYLFYATIAFALAYFPYYHWGPGSLPKEAWAKDMSAWYQAHPPPKLASAEELEAMAADPNFVAAGESIYKVRCISCHAMDGGGLVGPNLTDDFTLYGYERDQIVGVVYHGTKFGMLAWKDQLSLEEVYQVAAYVHTLRGTTPAKPKDPEGVPIVDAPDEPEADAEADADAPPPADEADTEGEPEADTEGEPAADTEGWPPTDPEGEVLDTGRVPEDEGETEGPPQLQDEQPGAAG